MKRTLKVALAFLANLLLSTLFIVSTSSPARAQNVNGLFSSTAQTITYIQQQQVFTPLPQATITVCNYPATQPSAALPCTNLANLYADATTSTPAPAQFAADSQGNFSFWAGVGYYAYTVTNLATNVTSGPYPVVISPGSGGGSGGAVFPTTPGVVYSTNPTTASNATSAQIVTALNLTPTSLLAPALLPLATTSTFGAVKPDGTSVTISNGVISSVPPAVTIPATSNVLKGTGVANVATAAAPGTDYVIPSGSITGSAGSLSVASLLPSGTTAVTNSNGDSSTKVATDAFVLANALGGVIYVSSAPSGSCSAVPPIQIVISTGVPYSCKSGTWTPTAGTPGGATTQLQFNNAGVFAGDSALIFNTTTKALTLGPIGSTAGSNSGPLLWTSLYDTGSGLALDTYDMHVQIGSGVNPFSQIVFDHPGGTPGGSEVLFLPQVHFAGSAVIQTGSVLQISDLTPSSNVCTDAFSDLSTAACGGSGSGALTPKDFGAVGDGVLIANGCTTNGTTTIVCAAGPFVSGDVGKEIWVTGAGAAGVAFGSTIATVVSGTTVTAAATPSLNVTSAQTVFGHDDVVPLQDCFNSSASSNVPCVMGVPINFNTPNGYLIASAGLLIPTHANIQGSSANEGTSILSEFNGDALSMPTSTASLQAGQPVQAVNLANFTIFHDPSQPNGRGIHLNAAAGVFGFGGMFNSTITNVGDEGAALECLWLDGHTNSDNNPNQYITINQLKCNGPNQSHPANEIKITGIQAQIIFMGGSIDGQSNHSFYPNPMIYLGEKTSGQADSPVDVKFYGFTCETATSCWSVNNGTNNIHIENSYLEAVDSPFIATSTGGLTINGNHLANVGNVTAVAQFLGAVTGSMQNNYVYGSTTPAAFAVCSGSNQIDFGSGNSGTVLTTSGCANQTVISSGTRAANSCTTPVTQTILGLTTTSVITPGYTSDPSGLAGWGTTGGMVFKAWPSAQDTMSWEICNQTTSPITYGAITFRDIWKQQ